MTLTRDIWAVLPIKDLTQAKQRLSSALSPTLRRGLAAAMAEDVLAALAATPELAGILVMTDDPQAIVLAQTYGCAISTENARSGHTAVVAAAARKLLQEGRGGMLVVPGDIPRVTPAEFSALIAAHAGSSGFSISPARDECGSNAIICSPPTLMPLTYGNDSYWPHLATARARGLEPVICPQPGIGLDIDHPEDLALFLESPSPTRAWAFLEAQGLTDGAPPMPTAGPILPAAEAMPAAQAQGAKL
ncbi:2-phospho-L-lactate guanylyltransferase [Bosea sp. BK604]|uniref:2-phospho-L-lactate guanylyltransferase n=1 Tax=Bosea sp. BK604 TaxID=2512180 RepID=UPI00104FF49B|nr:2-phospho-L-lactate guanylyltransferase [Bosea sp. BK604]TCR65643.1 phospholactate guanylyltransferase [Bosea sp. BK604]